MTCEEVPSEIYRIATDLADSISREWGVRKASPRDVKMLAFGIWSERKRCANVAQEMPLMHSVLYDGQRQKSCEAGQEAMANAIYDQVLKGEE